MIAFMCWYTLVQDNQMYINIVIVATIIQFTERVAYTII